MARLALDLGWSFGWCLEWRRLERLESGVVKLRAMHHLDGFRMVAKTEWLTATLKRIHDAGETLERVFYERITFVGDNGVAAIHAHGKQLGTVERWCALKKQPGPEGLDWDVVKKHATGHRSASQQTVFKVISGRFPEVIDHNQASAVAVMLTAKNKYQHQPESTPLARQHAPRAAPL